MVLQLKYEQVKSLSEDQFRRLTGVKCCTFDRMIKILEEVDKKKKNQVLASERVANENILACSNN